MRFSDLLVASLITFCVFMGFADARKRRPYRGTDPIKREADRMRWN